MQAEAIDVVFTSAEITSRIKRLQDAACIVNCPLSIALHLALCRLVGLLANFIKLLKLSCHDHKTFSLHVDLRIGYKDYICLLTYSINCIFPTAMNIHIYLYTVVINKTWLRQRTLIFTILGPSKKLTLRATVRGRERKFLAAKVPGTKVPGNESSMELSFSGAKVPPYGTFVPGSESSLERKFQHSKERAHKYHLRI